MSSLIDFFNNQATDKGLSHKNNLIKRNIIAYMATNGEVTLAELTKELKISIPTMTKLVQELEDEDIVSDLGKVETAGGRRPNVYGLTCSTLYFAGVHVGRDSMTCVITDIHNNLVCESVYDDFELTDREQCLETICLNTNKFLDECG